MLNRLGLTREQLAITPKITPILAQCGIQPKRLIDVLRGDYDKDSQKIVQLFDSLTPENRTIIGLEGLALACGLSPRRLWELYNGANLMQSRESIGAMIADALPSIMQVTIKDAKRAKGFASREHIYKAARVLPTPKGTIINLPGSQAQGQLEADTDEPEEGDLEPADGFIMRAAKAMNPKALPAPPPVVEAESEEEDEEAED